MLSGRPKISSHAFERAFERLAMRAKAFGDWVSSTHRDWLIVSAAYLRDRGLNVSSENDTYICPWTPRLSVALCIADDDWILTVMTFSEPEEKPETVDVAQPETTPTARKRLVSESAEARRAAARFVIDGGVSADKILATAIRNPIEGPLVDRAFDAYASHRIGLHELRSFFMVRHNRRKNLPYISSDAPTISLTAAEKQLISRAD